MYGVVCVYNTDFHVTEWEMETDSLPAELNSSTVPGQATDSQQEQYQGSTRFIEKQSKILLTPW